MSHRKCGFSRCSRRNGRIGATQRAQPKLAGLAGLKSRAFDWLITNSRAVFNPEKPKFIFLISTQDCQTRYQIWVERVEERIFYHFDPDVKHALNLPFITHRTEVRSSLTSFYLYRSCSSSTADGFGRITLCLIHRKLDRFNILEALIWINLNSLFWFIDPQLIQLRL